MLKAIDGTRDRGHAPPPSRGLIKAVYETVDALGGHCTEAQIMQMLPAAIDDSSQIGKKRVHTCMNNGVYRGYFVKQGSRYSIAPKAYWEARQQALAQALAEDQKKSKEVHYHFFSAEGKASRDWAIAGLVGFAAGIGLSGILILAVWYLA